MHSYVLYSDGACSGNPGPGGWAWILVEKDCAPVEHRGGEQLTTNNRMELRAAIEALAYVEKFCRAPLAVELRTDSQYVKNGIEKWIYAWKKNGWRTASKTPVKNKDLWEQLDRLVGILPVRFTWIEGHAGERWNERCDELARLGSAEHI